MNIFKKVYAEEFLLSGLVSGSGSKIRHCKDRAICIKKFLIFMDSVNGYFCRCEKTIYSTTPISLNKMKQLSGVV